MSLAASLPLETRKGGRLAPNPNGQSRAWPAHFLKELVVEKSVEQKHIEQFKKFIDDLVGMRTRPAMEKVIEELDNYPLSIHAKLLCLVIGRLNF